MKMEVATMTSKGQITIPVAVRTKLNLQQGDKVVFIEKRRRNKRQIGLAGNFGQR